MSLKHLQDALTYCVEKKHAAPDPDVARVYRGLQIHLQDAIRDLERLQPIEPEGPPKEDKKKHSPKK
jgi:hypothetical protein